MANSLADDPLLISHLNLRRAIGFLGIGLPLACLVHAFITGNCGVLEGSISAYYHTGIQNLFVGILCVTGSFLLAYKGYDYDKYFSRFAGLAALGVAFFPTGDAALCPPKLKVDSTVNTIHVISAGALFLTFAYMSIRLFTKSGGQITVEKRSRNKVYRLAGWIVVACVALMFAYMKFEWSWATPLNPIFWLETTALFAFGVSWLVKGETILSDATQDEATPEELVVPAV